MTLIVSWLGVDTHGPTSAYIAGDSRISWNSRTKFDYGKKVFSSKEFPEILSYSGDVLFPSIVLSQIIEMIDSNILFTKSLNCNEKNKLIFEKISHSFSKYPKLVSNIVQIMHISRDTIVNKYPKFTCYKMTWSNSVTSKRKTMKMPNQSDLLFVIGSGRNEFVENYRKYQHSVNKNTSRNVFHCFCDTLFNIRDKNCGGSPQLIGIYRKPNSTSINFGIILRNKRYLLGSEVPKSSNFNQIEWRNDNFEICDGLTMKKKHCAKKQIDEIRRK